MNRRLIIVGIIVGLAFLATCTLIMVPSKYGAAQIVSFGGAGGGNTDTFIYPALDTGTVVMTADGASVYCPTTSVATISAGDSYYYRLVIGGIDATHGAALYVLNGKTSAAKGYAWFFQSDSNITLNKYNGSAYTALRTQTTWVNQRPGWVVVEATVTFWSNADQGSANHVTFNNVGLAPVGDNVQDFSGGPMYVCAATQTASRIKKLLVEKLN